MTQDEIRKLLGGYATNALTVDERRILFEAALEDQELFNALQNEDALKELLDDPVLRDQVRRALVTPAKHSRRPGFTWRQWAFGVMLPAVVAVIAIVVMNRANAPKLISMREPAAAPSPKAEPNEVASKLQPIAPPPAAKKQSASVRVPRAQAIPAPVQIESARRLNAPVASAFSAATVRPFMPASVRQQFSAGFALDAPLYQGPLVRYSVVRSGPDGSAIRVEVSTAIAGYLALYQVDAAGNSKRVYPVSEPAEYVAPGVTIQIPSSPTRIADAGGRLRLVVIPATPSATIGLLGGAVNGTTLGTGTPPLPAPPPTPLIVDIPLAN
jgi:Domain of unknown function (DUF4384)